MSLFSKLFGKVSPEQPAGEAQADGERLVPVPIPALAVLLHKLEQHKGSPLTEAEVLAARDKAACIMLPLAAKLEMDKKRGYEDINPENAWTEWVVLRSKLASGEA
jgi:hypothetical protein